VVPFPVVAALHPLARDEALARDRARSRAALPAIAAILPLPPARLEDEARRCAGVLALRRGRWLIERWVLGVRAPAALDPFPVVTAELPATFDPALGGALALPVAGEPLPVAVAPVPPAAHPDIAGPGREALLARRRWCLARPQIDLDPVAVDQDVLAVALLPAGLAPLVAAPLALPVAGDPFPLVLAAAPVPAAADPHEAVAPCLVALLSGRWGRLARCNLHLHLHRRWCRGRGRIATMVANHLGL